MPYKSKQDKADAQRRWLATPEGRTKKRVAQRAEYQRNRPDYLARVAASEHRRRNAPGDLSAANIQALKDDAAGVCAYCLKPGATHIEHCTPLSRGGWNALDNVVMACPTCNLSKGTRTVLEFLCNG